jgi:CTD kinase subunit gamma
MLQGRTDHGHGTTSSPTSVSLSRNDVFKRIEEDRERHKRLRERRWVQPIAPQTAVMPPLATFLPLFSGMAHSEASAGDGIGGWERGEELPIDIEFENEWETTSDWNEDDEEAALEEIELCRPKERTSPMDVP